MLKKFAAFILISSLAVFLTGCVENKTNSTQSQAYMNTDNTTSVPATPTTQPTPAKLEITTIKAGTGATVKIYDNISVHYVGTLLNGTKFDSSRDRGEPFSFQIGAGYVIQGWDQGIIGMKVGEIRKLVIPPAMGYGSRAAGSIPANSTLVFEVELISID